MFKKKRYHTNFKSFLLIVGFLLFLISAAECAKFNEIAHFEPSQRGSIVLYYDGKRFTRDGTFADSTNWRCCYFRDKCRARAITKQINGETRVRVTNPIHTCTDKRKRAEK